MIDMVDQSELKDDLVQDMIEVLTSFCAKLYGRRSTLIEMIEQGNLKKKSTI